MTVARTILAAASLVAIAAPTAAFADWSFTRWGMSPDQVIKASGGKVTPATGDAGDRVRHSDRRAAGDVIHDGRAYRAEFYFDLDNDRGLRLVRLALKDPTQCEALDADLTARYGPTMNQYHGEWIDRGTGDTVFFSKSYKSIASLPCYLTYSRF